MIGTLTVDFTVGAKVVSFGQRLKAAREQLGLTQQELADCAKLSDKSYIGLLENDKRKNPSLEILSRLADCLFVSESYLISGEVTESLKMARAEPFEILAKAADPPEPSSPGRRRGLVIGPRETPETMFDDEIGSLFYNIKKLKPAQRKKLKSVMEIIDREVERLLKEQKDE